VIFHINQATYKAGLSEEQRRAGVEMMRQSGAANPAVKSYVVGPELGGEFEYGAVYVVEDLDGYWAYLTHPAHVREELEGIPLLEKFAAIDVSDSDDPELRDKIAALQARNYQEHPDVAALVAKAASFTVPDAKGSAAQGAPSQRYWLNADTLFSCTRSDLARSPALA
jgi:Stress responsive A/B Barrel Domain